MSSDMKPRVKKKRTGIIEEALVIEPPLSRVLDSFDPAPGAAGSIEQQLDMVEEGDLKGDEIDHSLHFSAHQRLDQADCDPIPLDELLDNEQMDLSLEDREGDEMTGDDHSSGLQGGEEELKHHPNISTGMPGDRTDHEEMENTLGEKRRIA